eukprot:Gb_09710 [translate_table: standard]
MAYGYQNTFESHCRILDQAELIVETDDFNTNLVDYSSSLPGLAAHGYTHHENAAIIMAEKQKPHFELHRPYSTETNWHSSSSEDADALYYDSHQNSSASVITCSTAQNRVYRHSAFVKYIGTANGVPAANFAPIKKNLNNMLKRCFKFLRTIDHEKRSERQGSSLMAVNCNIDEPPKPNFQDKAAFHHMIAERNRRVKLKQHFSSLRSLLPNNTKKDKHSILLNATRYLNELKLHIDILEERNRSLEASLRKDQKQGSSFESQEEATSVYRGDGVVVQQSNIPDQVEMGINVQRPFSNPTNMIITLLECLRELQLEVLSIQSDVQAFQFQANLVIKTKGGRWEQPEWKKVGEMMKQALSHYTSNDKAHIFGTL